MKNYKKVLDELKRVSPNFYVGGSLSLYVFHYITRTPKDLDINSTDPTFLEMAKEMQESFPVPIDFRGGWNNTRKGKNQMAKEMFSPDELTPEQEEKRRFLAIQRKKPDHHAAFMLHGVKVEVFENKVHKYHVVHGHNFMDPNEVLFYKYRYQYLKREKDIKDEAEAWSLLYPEKAMKSGDTLGTKIRYYEGELFTHYDFTIEKGKYVGNNLPTNIIEKVLVGKLQARSLAGHDKEAKKARENRLEFMRMFEVSKVPVEELPFDIYLSDEPKRVDEITFKLWGLPRDVPSVKLCPKTVLIKDDWERKIRIPRDVFEILRQVSWGDTPKSEQLQKQGMLGWRICKSNEVRMSLRFYPRYVTIKNEQGTSINLEHKAFEMLKTINYGMIA